jgi:CBS domain-containing protein
VAVFLYSASKSESRTVTVGELLDGLTVADLARTDVETVDAGESVARLLDQLVRDRRSELAVERDGTIVGVVSLQDARHVPQVDRDGHTVGDIATEPTVRFDTETDAFEALSGLSDAKETVAIVERDGQAVGVVSLSDFKSTLDGVQSLDSGRAEEGR